MTVYLVGAGPGDPGLLTVRGAELLRRADVVVYDRLASPALLELARAGAELVDVGKAPGRVAMTQEQINELLVDRGRAGLEVVRLKGGDPFVFGRGGEEAAVLAEAGIAWEVVPGISSAIAVPAYAGIPVTDRAAASSFAVITGHEDPDRETTRLRWQALAQGIDTLIFLMGVGRLESIAAQLIAHGRAAETPAAVVRQGTTPDQETVVGTLATIAADVAHAGLTAPATLIVGEVVRLRNRLSWFDTLAHGQAPAVALAELLYVVRES